MENRVICNIILDSCGLLILLMLLLPLIGGRYGRKLNGRKQNLLFYAALMHLFVLSLRLVGHVTAFARLGASSAQLFYDAALVPALFSSSLMILCILCDGNNIIRVSKGDQIPFMQIVCTVLPPVIAFCLRIAFPQFGFSGLAWSVALQLNQIIIQMERGKQMEAAEQRLSRDQALLMTVQMQPHFIFNMLSSIEALCQTDAAAAAESIENLSGYLRSNMDALSSEEPIPFDDELRHIRQYIALELADPARQFSFDYELEVRDFLLPALTVQPIVENAVKHGALTHRDGTGRVTLATEEAGEYIRIRVEDNGLIPDGLTDEQRERRGIGIESTRRRLAELCGGSLEYAVAENGTKVTILIPRKGG